MYVRWHSHNDVLRVLREGVVLFGRGKGGGMRRDPSEKDARARADGVCTVRCGKVHMFCGVFGSENGAWSVTGTVMGRLKRRGTSGLWVRGRLEFDFGAEIWGPVGR